MKADVPYSLDGVSLFRKDRDLLGTLISSIHKVYRGSNDEVVAKSAESTFRQVMEIRSGRWVRRSLFQIGHQGSRIDVRTSETLLSIRDE